MARRRHRSRSYEQGIRIELAPMIDVIFVLLTFFIYSVVRMVNADVFPMKLSPVSSEARAATRPTGTLQILTIDRNGQLLLNRAPVPWEKLDATLAEFARAENRPRLYLATEAESEKDRLPALLEVLGRIQAAGITNFYIVGPKSQKAPGAGMPGGPSSGGGNLPPVGAPSAGRAAAPGADTPAGTPTGP